MTSRPRSTRESPAGEGDMAQIPALVGVEEAAGASCHQARHRSVDLWTPVRLPSCLPCMTPRLVRLGIIRVLGILRIIRLQRTAAASPVWRPTRSRRSWLYYEARLNRAFSVQFTYRKDRRVSCERIASPSTKYERGIWSLGRLAAGERILACILTYSRVPRSI